MLPPLLAKLDSQQILIVAHRGASGHFMENTIEAFEKAIELGADMIELDVRLTGDGQIVCYHDDTINGTPVDSLSYSQITDKNIPLLDTVLEKFHDKIYFVIEVKPPRLGQNSRISLDIWLSLVSKYNLFGKIVFASEDLQYLFLLKHMLQEVFCCAVLSSAIESTWAQDVFGLDGIICSIAELAGGAASILRKCRTARLSAFALDDELAVNEDFSARSRQIAPVIGVYGVRTEEDIALCQQYNVRFIGTDYPEKIKN